MGKKVCSGSGARRLQDINSGAAADDGPGGGPQPGQLVGGQGSLTAVSHSLPACGHSHLEPDRHHNIRPAGMSRLFESESL